MIKNKLYQCKKCKFYYGDKDLAEECEEYCKSHKGCNLAITKHAIKQL